METYAVVLLSIFMNILFMCISLLLLVLVRLDTEPMGWFTVPTEILRDTYSRKTPNFFHPVYVYKLKDLVSTPTYPVFKDNSVTLKVGSSATNILQIIGRELPELSTSEYVGCQTVHVGKRRFICGSAADIPNDIPDKYTFLLYLGYVKDEHKNRADIIIEELDTFKFVRSADAYSLF